MCIRDRPKAVARLEAEAAALRDENAALKARMDALEQIVQAANGGAAQ